MIKISAEDEFRLIERVHECAGNPSLWPETLRCAHRTLCCDVRLIEVERDGEHTGRYCSFEDADLTLDFLRELHTEANRTALNFLLNDAALNYPYCKVQLVLNNPDGFPWPSGEEPEIAKWPGLIAPVHRTPDATILLACFWTTVAINEMNPDWVMSPFRRFAKAVSSALEISIQTAIRQDRNNALELMMDHQSDAMCLLDEDLSIHYSTPSCRAILTDGDIFTVADNRLVPVRRDLEAALQSVSRYVMQQRHGQDGSQLLNSHPLPEQSVLVADSENSLCRVSIRGLTNAQNVQGMGNPGYILVEVKKPTRLSKEMPPLLQSAFGLSKSEARLALDLASSGSITDTLDNLQITRNTAKTHLRRIYEKTSTQSQVELIQLIQSLNGLF
ncbi:helix-turn-helix transcriptional regulator [Roseibium sp.]|uniref:helix-turn-helix transcriptional regulator n=1 Tax=Roseibium sp. TaxID=1936156 RepID=UPI003A97FF53